MNDFDYQNIPYFKIEQDCTEEDFVFKWITFCQLNRLDMAEYKPKLGWLTEDFENFKITVVPILRNHI